MNGGSCAGCIAAVEEIARLTDRRIELYEGEKAAINQRLALVQEWLPEPTEVTITYFAPDKKKTGGAYISVTGTVKKIDGYERTVILQDGTGFLSMTFSMWMENSLRGWRLSSKIFWHL